MEDLLHYLEMSATESVRISKDLKQQLKELAKTMRPRTAVQYLIEDAIEQYLERIRQDVENPENNQKS